MKKNTLQHLALVSMFGLLAGLVLTSGQTFAVAPAPYKVICHHTPSNEVTHEFANEQSYNGHLGTPHSGETYDTDGACAESTPTPTPTPIVCEEEEEEEECPVLVTPTPTPTEETTPTPTPPQNIGGPGDGLSDGRSDGRSSCPECTKAPQGQVLGATTDFAATGVADQMLMNVLGIIGGLSAVSGMTMIAKKRSDK